MRSSITHTLRIPLPHARIGIQGVEAHCGGEGGCGGYEDVLSLLLWEMTRRRGVEAAVLEEEVHMTCSIAVFSSL
jgi:hypothetical protein